MSPGESTWPVAVERPNGSIGSGQSAEQTSDAWSFGSRERLFAPLKPQPAPEPESARSAAANSDLTSTASPPARDISELKPVAPERPSFGKRGFAPLYQWEGVVEEVNDIGFRARLVPFEDGQPDASRIEYADFEFDDLADDSDRELVVEGAVFYWTVGKSRNTAGTNTNTSLVRFRRLLAATPYQMRKSAREAAELLTDLGGD